jgi:eukaryotic-like serine/threonine-protein kinase
VNGRSLGTPGDVAGRYTIERELGRGATSMVYLARDSETGRQVALKVLRPEFTESMGAKRFLKEIRMTAALVHPHIIPVLDSGESRGQLYFVIPYMEGDTLRARLRREKQLTLDSAIGIVRTLADALDYAHGKGVIHRDVKPENILFHNGEACLADFGVARALEHAFGDTTTSTGIVRGTPAYMSPEQASGDQNVDGRSDIYALGCVLYEMLAGMPAFSGPTPQSVIAQRITHGPRSLMVYRPAVPASVEKVIERAMMLVPADRYQTAGEFAEALSAATVERLAVQVPAARAGRRQLLIGIAAALLIGAAAFAWRSGLVSSWIGHDDASLDQNRLAVAPFEVLDPADTTWRIGLVDLLSRNFDGAGPLRTVPPTTVVNGWQGRADIASASSLGRRTGAALVVFGQWMRAGRDTARVAATLVDLRTRRSFEVEVRDGVEHVDRLVDSISVRVLRELGRTRAIAAVPKATIGSKSYPALKLFLQGEQYYRGNDMKSADAAYRQAIHEDTTFALAYRRLRGVLRTTTGRESDAESYRYALSAGERNHGLAPRDSLLIVADSLAAAKAPGTVFLDDAGFARLRRRMTALEQAAKRYPDDPEVQFELGEASYHIGERVGVSQRRALSAFLESIHLDPAFRPSYYHAVELILPLDGAEAALKLAQQYDRLSPSIKRYRLFRQLLEGAPRSSPRAIAGSDEEPVSAVFEAIELTRRWPDSGATAVSLAQRLLRRRELSAGDSLRAQTWLSSTLLFRGRARQSYAAVTPLLLSESLINLIHLALMGIAPADSALREAERWTAKNDMRGLYLEIPILAAQRDTAALKNLSGRFEALARGSRGPEFASWGTIGRGSAQAHLALVRGDTTLALERLLAIPDSLCSWWCGDNRLLTAQLLMVAGRSKEAADRLDGHPPGAGPTTLAEPQWMYERARAAERLGSSDDARRNFEFLVRAWATADSELGTKVRYAREALSGRTSRQ